MTLNPCTEPPKQSHAGSLVGGLPCVKSIIPRRSSRLEANPLTIGMAGGRDKVASIVGAARAQLINALVTEEEPANMCLQMVKAI